MQPPGFIYNLGFRADSDKQTVHLDLPRVNGLKTSKETAAEFQVLIPLVQHHARSQYIYAAPDCPEVYFLSGLRNPTRTIFDFFNEPPTSTERVMKEIEGHDINEVVLLTTPAFSPAISTSLKQELEVRFPNWAAIGRFQVRWRE